MDKFKIKGDMRSLRNDMLAHHTNEDIEDIDQILESKKEDLYRQSLHNQMSFTIIDLLNSRFTINISAFKDCFTFDSINADDRDNWEHLCPLIHPDDRDFYYESDVLGYHYLMNLSVEERKYFQMIYILRLKDKKHGYRVYLFRFYVLLSCKKGHPRLIIGETIQLPFCIANEEFQPYRQFCLISEKSQEITKHFDAHNPNELTGLEMQILKLRSANNSIKITAKMLNITPKKVQKLCTEIIKRLNTSNITETSYLARLMRMFTYLLMGCHEGIP